MLDEQWRTARRILAVRLDNLGDVLVTTPALHAIKESLPQAHLTLLVSAVGAQVAALDPDVDDTIVYAAPWMDTWRQLPQDSVREQRMIETLRAGGYDGAIIFTSYHQSPLPAAYLCYLADIPLRAAASIDGPGSLLTTRHKHPTQIMHEVERGLDLVGALGMYAPDTDLRLRIPAHVRSSVQSRLRALGVMRSSSHNPVVVVHPGCSMPARTYPREMYAEVVTRLIHRLGATVLLTGAPDEHALVKWIYEAMPNDARGSVHPLAGTLSFAELCALIESADCTITNNTGPMHIAAATKTPVVALFALTNPPEQWGPWRVANRTLFHDVPCRICYSRVCPYGHECLRLVSPDMVVSAAADLLEETRAGERDATRPAVGAGQRSGQ